MSSARLVTPSGFDPLAYLARFGHVEGRGLGKQQQGRTQHLTVTLKDDTKGVGARDDYTKSFEKLFNQAASQNGALANGITFFDTDDEDAPAESKEAPAVQQPPPLDEEQQRRARKEEKKRKKKEKKQKEAAGEDMPSSAVPISAVADQPEERRSKKSKHSHGAADSAAATAASASASASASPSPPPVASVARTLPSSSPHFIRFNMGSKLLADSHTEVDLQGNSLRRDDAARADKKDKKAKKNKRDRRDEEEDAMMQRGGLGLGARPTADDDGSSSDSDGEGAPVVDSDSEAESRGMRYISSSVPRPAASCIPRAKENHTLKTGERVAAVNGAHLYHDRTPGKLRRLEEADRAFMERMKNGGGGGATSTPAPSAAAGSPTGAFTSPLFTAPSPSPSPSPPPADAADTPDAPETPEQRAARKAAKRLKKEKKEQKRAKKPAASS